MRGLRFASLLLAALSMSMAFCHLLEMPARLEWSARLWIETTVTGAVFRMFGTVGGALEVGAVLAAAWLALRLRARPGPTRAYALAGALLLVVSHAVFWLLVAPVNAEIARWTPATSPADWARWRAQWEYSHAVRAVLQVGALGALAWSALVELPR